MLLRFQMILVRNAENLMQGSGGVRRIDGRSSRVKARAMTLLEIFKIEREVAENPPLPGLTVRRIPASNPDHICWFLNGRRGTKPDRTKSVSFTITTIGNCEWSRKAFK